VYAATVVNGEFYW